MWKFAIEVTCVSSCPTVKGATWPLRPWESLKLCSGEHQLNTSWQKKHFLHRNCALCTVTLEQKTTWAFVQSKKCYIWCCRKKRNEMNKHIGRRTTDVSRIACEISLARDAQRRIAEPQILRWMTQAKNRMLHDAKENHWQIRQILAIGLRMSMWYHWQALLALKYIHDKHVLHRVACLFNFIWAHFSSAVQCPDHSIRSQTWSNRRCSDSSKMGAENGMSKECWNRIPYSEVAGKGYCFVNTRGPEIRKLLFVQSWPLGRTSRCVYPAYPASGAWSSSAEDLRIAFCPFCNISLEKQSLHRLHPRSLL